MKSFCKVSSSRRMQKMATKKYAKDGGGKKADICLPWGPTQALPEASGFTQGRVEPL